MAGRKGTARHGSGIDPETGEWTPAYPGQRAPFGPGNRAAATHGATSARIVGEAAAGIEAELRASPWAPWLRDPALDEDVAALARCMASERLVEAWLDRAMSFGEALDVADDPDAEPAAAAEAHAVMTAMERLRLVSGRAARLRHRLGLDPLSMATAPASAPWRQAAARCGVDPVADFREQFGPGLRDLVN